MRRPLFAALLAAAGLAGCAGSVRPPPLPLHQAAAVGDLGALARALDRGEDPGAAEPTGAPPAAPGWAEAREKWALPYVYRMPPTAAPDLERTPLHFAAAAGQPASVELLLRRGAGLEARDARGRTALHYAAGFDRAAVTALLLDLGAARGTVDDEGWTPLHVAASLGALGSTAVLLDRGAAPTEGTRPYGDTPLHLAAFGGHRAVAELLLARGADPRARSKLGWTPADLAAGRGFGDVVELLESRGAPGAPPPANRHLGLP